MIQKNMYLFKITHLLILLLFSTLGRCNPFEQFAASSAKHDTGRGKYRTATRTYSR